MTFQEQKKRIEVILAEDDIDNKLAAHFVSSVKDIIERPLPTKMLAKMIVKTVENYKDSKKQWTKH